MAATASQGTPSQAAHTLSAQQPHPWRRAVTWVQQRRLQMACSSVNTHAQQTAAQVLHLQSRPLWQPAHPVPELVPPPDRLETDSLPPYNAEAPSQSWPVPAQSTQQATTQQQAEPHPSITTRNYLQPPPQRPQQLPEPLPARGPAHAWAGSGNPSGLANGLKTEPSPMQELRRGAEHNEPGADMSHVDQGTHWQGVAKTGAASGRRPASWQGEGPEEERPVSLRVRIVMHKLAAVAAAGDGPSTALRELLGGHEPDAERVAAALIGQSLAGHAVAMAACARAGAVLRDGVMQAWGQVLLPLLLQDAAMGTVEEPDGQRRQRRGPRWDASAATAATPPGLAGLPADLSGHIRQAASDKHINGSADGCLSTRDIRQLACLMSMAISMGELHVHCGLLPMSVLMLRLQRHMHHMSPPQLVGLAEALANMGYFPYTAPAYRLGSNPSEWEDLWRQHQQLHQQQNQQHQQHQHQHQHQQQQQQQQQQHEQQQQQHQQGLATQHTGPSGEAQPDVADQATLMHPALHASPSSLNTGDVLTEAAHQPHRLWDQAMPPGFQEGGCQQQLEQPQQLDWLQQQQDQQRQPPQGQQLKQQFQEQLNSQHHHHHHQEQQRSPATHPDHQPGSEHKRPHSSSPAFYTARQPWSAPPPPAWLAQPPVPWMTQLLTTVMDRLDEFTGPQVCALLKSLARLDLHPWSANGPHQRLQAHLAAAVAARVDWRLEVMDLLPKPRRVVGQHTQKQPQLAREQLEQEQEQQLQEQEQEQEQQEQQQATEQQTLHMQSFVGVQASQCQDDEQPSQEQQHGHQGQQQAQAEGAAQQHIGNAAVEGESAQAHVSTGSRYQLFHPHEVHISLWALLHLSLPVIKGWLRLLLGSAAHQARHLTPRSLVAVFRIMAEYRCALPPGSPALARLWSAVHRRWEHFSPASLASLLWYAHHAGTTPPPSLLRASMRLAAKRAHAQLRYTAATSLSTTTTILSDLEPTGNNPDQRFPTVSDHVAVPAGGTIKAFHIVQLLSVAAAGRLELPPAQTLALAMVLGRGMRQLSPTLLSMGLWAMAECTPGLLTPWPGNYRLAHPHINTPSLQFPATIASNHSQNSSTSKASTTPTAAVVSSPNNPTTAQQPSAPTPNSTNAQQPSPTPVTLHEAAAQLRLGLDASLPALLAVGSSAQCARVAWALQLLGLPLPATGTVMPLLLRACTPITTHAQTAMLPGDGSRSEGTSTQQPCNDPQTRARTTTGPHSNLVQPAHTGGFRDITPAPTLDDSLSVLQGHVILSRASPDQLQSHGEQQPALAPVSACDKLGLHASNMVPGLNVLSDVNGSVLESTLAPAEMLGPGVLATDSLRGAVTTACGGGGGGGGGDGDGDGDTSVPEEVAGPAMAAFDGIQGILGTGRAYSVAAVQPGADTHTAPKAEDSSQEEQAVIGATAAAAAAAASTAVIGPVAGSAGCLSPVEAAMVVCVAAELPLGTLGSKPLETTKRQRQQQTPAHAALGFDSRQAQQPLTAAAARGIGAGVADLASLQARPVEGSCSWTAGRFCPTAARPAPAAQLARQLPVLVAQVQSVPAEQLASAHPLLLPQYIRALAQLRLAKRVELNWWVGACSIVHAQARAGRLPAAGLATLLSGAARGTGRAGAQGEGEGVFDMGLDVGLLVEALAKQMQPHQLHRLRLSRRQQQRRQHQQHQQEHDGNSLAQQPAATGHASHDTGSLSISHKVGQPWCLSAGELVDVLCACTRAKVRLDGSTYNALCASLTACVAELSRGDLARAVLGLAVAHQLRAMGAAAELGSTAINRLAAAAASDQLLNGTAVSTPTASAQGDASSSNNAAEGATHACGVLAAILAVPVHRLVAARHAPREHWMAQGRSARKLQRAESTAGTFTGRHGMARGKQSPSGSEVVSSAAVGSSAQLAERAMSSSDASGPLTEAGACASAVADTVCAMRPDQLASVLMGLAEWRHPLPVPWLTAYLSLLQARAPGHMTHVGISTCTAALLLMQVRPGTEFIMCLTNQLKHCQGRSRLSGQEHRRILDQLALLNSLAPHAAPVTNATSATTTFASSASTDVSEIAKPADRTYASSDAAAVAAASLPSSFPSAAPVTLATPVTPAAPAVLASAEQLASEARHVIGSSPGSSSYPLPATPSQAADTSLIRSSIRRVPMTPPTSNTPRPPQSPRTIDDEDDTTISRFSTRRSVPLPSVEPLVCPSGIASRLLRSLYLSRLQRTLGMLTVKVLGGPAAPAEDAAEVQGIMARPVQRRRANAVVEG